MGNIFTFKEASYFDRIDMTENWLEFDRKISQRWTLLFEYDRKMFTTTNFIFWIWPKFITPTNINFTPKKYASAVGLDRSPSPSSHWLGHLPSLASPVASLLYKKKTSGTEVRRTPDVKLRFVGFNFSHIQKVMFVVVINSVKFKR